MKIVLLQFPFLKILLVACLLAIIILLFCKKILCIKEMNIIWGGVGVIYSIGLFAVLFYPSVLYSAEPVDINYIQLMPLKSIINFILNKNYLQIILGIIICIPLVTILQNTFKKVSQKKINILSLMIVLCIEPIQFLINIATRFPNKVVDIDDTILNVLGLVISIIVFKFFNKYLFKKL